MRRELLAALILISLLLSFVPLHASTRARAAAAAQQDDSQKPPKIEFVPGNVLVRFRPGSALAAGARAPLTLRSTGGRQIPAEADEAEGLQIVEGLRVARVAPEETLAAVEALRRRPDVLYAEPDYVRRKDAAPDDPRYAEMWALKNTGQSGGTTGADIHAEAAWDVTTGSRQVVVGVVDEGVDINHPDLQPNVWTNPGEIPGNDVDDDGDGFVDDVHGWDFFHNDATVYDGSPSDNDTDAHGTHVAGTVGAAGNNGAGVAGVNWQVSLMPLKALGAAGESPAPSSVSTTIRAYGYARMMRDLWVSSGGARGANVRVLNNSYGGPVGSQAERDAIRALAASQILFVASAGNDGTDADRFQHFPSGYDEPNVISVAASDRFDHLAAFSNYGAASVHLAAPGVEILSTTPNGTYSVFSGTSMAAPHVSGAAALLCAANPNISLQRLRAALLYSGDELPSLSPTNTNAPSVATSRRLNVAASLASAAEADSTAPAAVGNFRVSSQSGRSVTLSWTAPGDDGNTGRARIYELRFSDTDLSADAQFTQARRLVAPLPANAGTAQSFNVKLPFRHPTGFFGIRAVDNAGNAGPVASVGVSVDQAVADPYVVTEGPAQPLSTGGTPLGLVGDDKLKQDYILPFSFPLFDSAGNGVTVSTNGTIYFTSPPPKLANGDAADAFSSRDGLLSYRMIAGLWDDLRTDRRPGDDVYVVTPDSNHIIFRWQAVTFDTPTGPGTTRGEHPVSFEVELGRDGTIQVRYGDGNESVLPVVGISGGEPDAYVSDSHTSESSFVNLTNAPTLTFALRNPPHIRTDLLVRMKGTPNPVATGQQLTYSIDYVNQGPDFDRDATITDQLPAGTTFVSCSGGGTCTAPPVGAGGTVTLKPSNASTSLDVPFTVVVSVTAPAGSKLVNTATAAGLFEDPDPSNNSATVTTDVVAAGVFAGVRAIGAGDSHTLAAKGDGTVWGWGANNSGEATNSADSSSSTPIQVGGLTDVTALSGGGFHSLALRSDGTVWAWGMNSVGQLGRDRSFNTVAQPLGQVKGLSGVTAVSAGEFFSLALLKDGTVWTWGDNTEGQLGDGTTIERPKPTPVKFR
ncbi:MAG: S8 family serine peptidase, partial [Acidobacteriota bacterium]|nr:S8 family serine peptidase [Acidobacteriota bacterium]